MAAAVPIRAGRPTARRQSNRACPRATVLHGALPGRVRIRLSGWQPAESAALERRLLLVPGVRTVRATPETSNVLITFDPEITTVERLLSAAESAVERRTTTPVPPAGTTWRRPAAPLARKLFVHLPALLGLVLSLLACTTPLGYARLGLKALSLAIQIGTASA